MELPTCLDTPAFREAWAAWEQHRKELRVKKYTPTGQARQLKRLAGWGHDRAVAAIDYSMAQNYQGIFEQYQEKKRDLFDGLRIFAQGETG